MTTPAGDNPPVAAAGPSGAAATASPGPQYFSHRQIVAILFGVMAGMLLAALDQGVVGTALPRIVSDLGGLDRLSWVVTAYLLTSTAATPLRSSASPAWPARCWAAGSPTARAGAGSSTSTCRSASPP